MVSGAGSAGAEKELAASARKGRAGGAVALACSPRNWPPRRPSLTHPGPRRPGARRLSTASRCPGSAHPLWQLQLGQPPRRYEPRLSVASVLSIQQPGSRKKASRRWPHPGSVTCSARGPASSVRSSLLALPNATTERRSLAPLLRRPF